MCTTSGYDKCCCCLTLRTCCIGISILEIFYQLLMHFVLSQMGVQAPLLTIIPAHLIALIIIGILLYGIIMRKRSFLWLWITFNITNVIFLVGLYVMCSYDFYNDPATVLDFECDARDVHGLSNLFMVQLVLTLIVYMYIRQLCAQHVCDQHNRIHDVI